LALSISPLSLERTTSHPSNDVAVAATRVCKPPSSRATLPLIVPKLTDRSCCSYCCQHAIRSRAQLDRARQNGGTQWDLQRPNSEVWSIAE
ncbi:hypothetical protein CH063_01145, partial [Colletotrichum higginsianum]